MPKSQHVRLLYVLPTFLIIVSTLIITSSLQSNLTNVPLALNSQQFSDNYNGFSLTLPPQWETVNLNRPQGGSIDFEVEYLIKPTSVNTPSTGSLPESIIGNTDYSLPGLYLGLMRDEIDMDYYLGLSGRDCGECAFAFIHQKSSVGEVVATKIDSDFPSPDIFPDEQHRSYTYYLFNASGHGWIIAFPQSNSPVNTISTYQNILSSFKISPEIGLNYTWTNHSANLSFMYPSLFKLEVKDNLVSISHSINFSHPNPCNFSGTTNAPLDQLTDFHLSLKSVPQNLSNTVTKELGKDFANKNLNADHQLTISKGFIDASNIGDLKGYRITQGVEGCGNYIYYFPIARNETLVATRKMITELSPIISGFEKNLNLPGVIPPYTEGKIFTRVMSSIKFP